MGRHQLWRGGPAPSSKTWRRTQGECAVTCDAGGRGGVTRAIPKAHLKHVSKRAPLYCRSIRQPCPKLFLGRPLRAGGFLGTGNPLYASP